ncbi:hypothetical protein ACVXZZ_09080 [Staphylococcus aureus]
MIRNILINLFINGIYMKGDLEDALEALGRKTSGNAVKQGAQI